MGRGMEVYRPRPDPEEPGDANEVGALSEPLAARFLGIGYRTLWALRKAGRGPRFFRCGTAIRYPRHLLVAWMEERSEGGSP